MTVESFDFRKPGRLPDFVGSILKEWEDKLARCVSANWQRQFGTEIELLVKVREVFNGAEIAKRYEVNALSNKVRLLRDEAESLVCIPRETALMFVEGLLGNIRTEQPEGEEADEEPVEARELTDMEQGLLKLLFSEFVSSIGEAQPEHLKVTPVGGVVQNWKETAWDIDAEKEMVLVQFEIITPFGGKTIDWIVCASLVEELALRVANATDVNKEESEVGHLVLELPVEVNVRLGARQLEMRELANLKPGDVLVLDQRINQPLTAFVEGVPKYVGWPGKLGNRRVFQVSKS